MTNRKMQLARVAGEIDPGINYDEILFSLTESDVLGICEDSGKLTSLTREKAIRKVQKAVVAIPQTETRVTMVLVGAGAIIGAGLDD